MPQTDDVQAINEVRKPLLAALGAGNMASDAVLAAVNTAGERAGEGREGVRKTLDDARKAAEILRSSADVSAITGAPRLRWDRVSIQDALEVRLDRSHGVIRHATLILDSVEKNTHREWSQQYPLTNPNAGPW